jgi:hypothetical protein
LIRCAVEAEADVESEARRHKACKVLVSSGLFFSLSFSLLRGSSSTDCLSCVDWATSVFFLGRSAPFEHIGIGWALFGKRYMDIY